VFKRKKLFLFLFVYLLFLSVFFFSPDSSFGFHEISVLEPPFLQEIQTNIPNRTEMIDKQTEMNEKQTEMNEHDDDNSSFHSGSDLIDDFVDFHETNVIKIK
jgi:hypothetical protein